MEKKYTVNQAIWIAAAAYAYSQYKKKAVLNIADVYMKAPQLREWAALFTGGTVQFARIHQYCNGDHKYRSNGYLRRMDRNSDGPFYRVTAAGELKDVKEWPEDIDPEDIITFKNENYSIGELREFVTGDYKVFVDTHKIYDKDSRALKGVRHTGLDDKGGAEVMMANENTPDKLKFDKNMILYGPPGTGKTYSTAMYAVAICEGDPLSVWEKKDYLEVMARYRALVEEKRIAFTTFHQSYGYEEFMEGIKPVIKKDAAENTGKELQYTIEEGIFKKFCTEAKKPTIKTDKFDIADDVMIWKVTVRSEVRDDCFENNRVRIDWGMDTDGAAGFVDDMKPGDIIITTDGSRTYINGIAVIKRDTAYDLGEGADNTTRDVQWLAKNIREDITSINDGKILHRMTVARVPSMSAADIVALAAKCNPELKSTEIEKNTKPYVFIIDEINRGNISKIFGELITLIEDTKREGMPEAAHAILPYSGDKFSVPSNVYILGTMNTADRSIALMDTALRRRFQFVEMMPDVKVLKEHHIVVKDGAETLDVADMLDAINKRIEFLYDREHTIGHAFFMGLEKDPSIHRLASIFKKSVIPLLQEYFYEDYQKIQLVLGDNAKIEADLKFIKDTKVSLQELFVGRVEDLVDEVEKTYEINPDALYRLGSYKGIAPGL